MRALPVLISCVYFSERPPVIHFAHAFKEAATGVKEHEQPLCTCSTAGFRLIFFKVYYSFMSQFFCYVSLFFYFPFKMTLSGVKFGYDRPYRTTALTSRKLIITIMLPSNQSGPAGIGQIRYDLVTLEVNE